MAFDVGWLLEWVEHDSRRMGAVVSAVSIAVALKYCLAAYWWRRISGQYTRQYFLVWIGGTASVVLLALLLSRVARNYMAPDTHHLEALMVLLALLAVPLGRVGLAPSCLARNRHR